MVTIQNWLSAYFDPKVANAYKIHRRIEGGGKGALPPPPP